MGEERMCGCFIPENEQTILRQEKKDFSYDCSVEYMFKDSIKVDIATKVLW